MRLNPLKTTKVSENDIWMLLMFITCWRSGQSAKSNCWIPILVVLKTHTQFQTYRKENYNEIEAGWCHVRNAFWTWNNYRIFLLFASTICRIGNSCFCCIGSAIAQKLRCCNATISVYTSFPLMDEVHRERQEEKELTSCMPNKLFQLRKCKKVVSLIARLYPVYGKFYLQLHALILWIWRIPFYINELKRRTWKILIVLIRIDIYIYFVEIKKSAWCASVNKLNKDEREGRDKKRRYI